MVLLTNEFEKHELLSPIFLLLFLCQWEINKPNDSNYHLFGVYCVPGSVLSSYLYII